MQPLKVGAAVLIEFLLQHSEIREAVPENPSPLIIESLLAVEKVDDTAADDRVERHERSLVLAGDTRPAVVLMRIPGLGDTISIHGQAAFVLIVAGQSTLAHAEGASQACRGQDP